MGLLVWESGGQDGTQDHTGKAHVVALGHLLRSVSWI